MDLAAFVRAHARGLLLALLVACGVIALAGLIMTQNRAASARDEALRWQSRSYDVMIRAQAMAGSVASAEAALGRYVISGEKPLGRRYVELWRLARAQLEALAREVADNPPQRADIARLRKAFEARGHELDEIAGYSNFKRNMTAFGLYYKQRDTPALREVNGTLARMIDREHGLLVERTSTASSAVAQSNQAARMLTLFGVLLVGGVSLLGWLTAQTLAERATAAAEAESERERAEELALAVDSATAQLREEAHERAQAEARLRQSQKMEAVGQLTGGIAHDFNNMLAVVLGGLELAKRRLRDEGPVAAEKHIDNAIEGANRAAALTRQLLAFARAEPTRPEAVDAGALLAGMSDLLDRTLGDEIVVRTIDSSAGWHIWADRHQLENAVLNLAVNARDAMDGRGTITIATGTAVLREEEIGSCAAGDYVTVAVIDGGHGMTPEVLERVFEPFFTTKPVGKGTGLGLSQIFAFAREANGEIAIDSAPGKGTRVTLYLPRHVREEPAQAAPAPSDVFASSVSMSNALTVLVIEDDPRVLASTVGALKELGHRPVSCADPLTAPGMVASLDRIDLIMSDVLMPGRSGPETIAALGDSIAGVGVLFVTGFAGEVAAEMLAGHHVLRKPFTLVALQRAIETTLADQRGIGAVAAE